MVYSQSKTKQDLLCPVVMGLVWSSQGASRCCQACDSESLLLWQSPVALWSHGPLHVHITVHAAAHSCIVAQTVQL